MSLSRVTCYHYLRVTGSSVYGSDEEDEEALRDYKGGLLKCVMYLETKRTITNIHILGPTNPMIILTGTNSFLLSTMHCNVLSDNEANSYEFFE